MKRRTGAIYIRVSSDAQADEGTSLQTQEEACKRYAQDHGIQVNDDHVFRDVHTGTELWERSALTHLRDGVRERCFSVVIVHALDRLSRQQHHQGLLLSEFEHHGVQLEIVTEPLDDTAEGRFLRHALGFVAEIERDRIRERTMRGRQRRAQLGKPSPGRRPPYGYAWNEERSAYVIDKEEAGVIRLIFEKATQGASLSRIAAFLSNQGVSSPRGTNQWSRATITHVLHNLTYWGEPVAFRWRKEERVSIHPLTNVVVKKTVMVQRPQEEWIALPATVAPALVSREIAQRAQQCLEHNRRAVRHEPGIHSLLRGGFAKCGHCGGNMAIQTRRRPNSSSTYRCSEARRHGTCRCQSIQIHVLDEITWRIIVRSIKRTKFKKEALDHQAQRDPLAAELERIDARLREIRRMQANLSRVAALLDDDEAVVSHVANLKQLAVEKARLETDRIEHEQRYATWQERQEELDRREAWRQEVAKTIDSMTLEQKRTLLHHVEVEVTVYRTDHRPRIHIQANIPLWRENVHVLRKPGGRSKTNRSD